MARRKISIEEAFKVLEEAGIPVQVKQAELDAKVAAHQAAIMRAAASAPPVKPKVQLFPVDLSVFPNAPGVIKATPTHSTIKLFAKHSIGSGGTMTANADGKQVEHAGVVTYGPGVCTVPTAYVAQLLSQDHLAKEADARMLDKEQRSYLVVQRINDDGHRVNVGIRVDGGLDNLGSLPDNHMLFLR